jgi:ABC-type multidrug transport system fused ATPase/permease subunit
VILKDAPILLLDEATSALDNVTEEAVMRAIANQLDDVTLVMIAHRLSTVSFCDTIFYIENGQVVESGGFEHLKNCCEPFRQMVDAVR